ncbi:2-oxoacid:acceptor oxidoreductase, gamma subunit,pyruvate/2-ketoisovalerate [Moorella glycerini]|uniref:Pyruvate synthase subunit PorC n=1 Tax=Neomoorella stamsii TaxID=1266720 RepID=A0A9X7J3I6_9FIRM|nr:MULTISPECIES: 2-oxoacid:acceptor oxidoreductase family protein [Moorella]PRR72634.1 Pyruvate synthase subunit PorC [Moorella stamsii]CEP67791.1 2-oxoacid:acceptor oxidoreductase, gamma subunit,pyruvate/2-ketoisovalerate [Moorella glycerini]
MDFNLKIALAGEGGQGVQSVAEIITEAAYQAGFQALYIPNFGVEQRGGVSVAFVQISREPVSAPKFTTGDIVVALSHRAVERVRQYVGDKTLLVYEAGLEDDVRQVYGKRQRRLAVPALAIAQEEMHPRVFNVIILGVLVGVTGFLERRDVEQALERQFGHKFAQDPGLRELNYRALERGYEIGRENL